MLELHSAIIAVMNEVGYVQKTGDVSFGNTKYKYAGETDLLKALRPVMLKHGLRMHCYDIVPVNCQGKVLCKYRFQMVHESGDSIEIAALGEGADSGDKAAYKAATGALKYALRQTFLIETGDDPDNTSSEEQVQAEKERRKAYKKSVTVELKEGGEHDWQGDIETLFSNCDCPFKLKAIYDANKASFDKVKQIDAGIVDALRTAYQNRANELK